MGKRFRKSIKVAPGVKVNLGKKSVGVSVGGKHGGISYNTKSGAHARVSAPGTGLSYTTKIGGVKKASTSSSPSPDIQLSKQQKKPIPCRSWFFVLSILVLVAGIASLQIPAIAIGGVMLFFSVRARKNLQTINRQSFVAGETTFLCLSGIPMSLHPLRGYTNFGIFEVHGKNPETGRQNKRTIEALTDQDAIDQAKEVFGLVDPITVQEVQRPMATDRQISYGNELGIEIPPNISTVDASAIICRMEDDDAPDDILAKEEWDAACQAGVVISALCGHTFYNSAMKNAKRVK